MADMTTFFATMLTTIADFLASDPVIYLFGLICLSQLIKLFRQHLP